MLNYEVRRRLSVLRRSNISSRIFLSLPGVSITSQYSTYPEVSTSRHKGLDNPFLSSLVLDAPTLKSMLLVLLRSGGLSEQDSAAHTCLLT